jgi:hypothetical protein
LTNTDWWYGGLTASIEVQRDVVRAVDWVKGNYSVDEGRIYIAGFSAGGGIALTMAAKYPDLFAAAVDYAGPTDLKEWMEYLYTTGKGGSLVTNVGCFPQECDFRWKRRSARMLAGNLKHVPLRVVHGTADASVLVGQSLDLFATMGLYFEPTMYSKGLVTHTAGHVYPVSGLSENDLEWLNQHRLDRTDPPQDLIIRSDESKSYYWLTIEREWLGDDPHMNNVVASFDRGTNTIRVDKADDERQYGAAFYLVFDLQAMGLDQWSTYTVEEYEPETGEFWMYTATPSASSLRIRVERNALSRHVDRRFVLYPQAAQTPVAREYGASGDTYITYEEPTTPQEGSWALKIKNNNWFQSLLAFDLSDVPANASIKSAVLDLYCTSKYPEHGSSLPGVQLYPLEHTWNASQATWSMATGSTSWLEPGLAVDGDYDSSFPQPLTGSLSGTGRSYRFIMPELVQQWASGQRANLGVVMRCEPSYPGSVTYSLASSEHSNAEWRPRLSVMYLLSTPVATPTQTLTPTASPTATSTASPTSTATPTDTATPFPSATLTQTLTATPSPTYTATATVRWNRLWLPVALK